MASTVDRFASLLAAEFVESAQVHAIRLTGVFRNMEFERPC